MNAQAIVARLLETDENVHGPFHWTVGTVQLFITADNRHVDGHIWVPASSPSYHRNDAVGSAWERRVAERACNALNELWQSGRREFSEHDVQRVLKQMERLEPYDGPSVEPSYYEPEQQRDTQAAIAYNDLSRDLE